MANKSLNQKGFLSPSELGLKSSKAHNKPLNEGELRKWFESTLITPAGTRGTVFKGDLETGEIPNKNVEILESLHIIRGEFRAGARWYELTHDRLIGPILLSNRAWQDRRQAARIWRIKRVAFFAIFLALILFLSIVVRNWTLPLSQNAVTDNIRITATAISSFVEATSVAQDGLNARYTAEANAVVATTTSEAALQEIASTQTAVVQKTIQAQTTATAISVRATTEFIVAEATRTKEELSRLSQPVRPLQPGISIGSASSSTAGTLSAFVQDSQGIFYLIGPSVIMGTESTPILQPSPIDNGRLEDVVAFTAPSLQPPLGATISTTLLLTMAELDTEISFQSIIPNIGPVIGYRSPILGEVVQVAGRTSGIVETTIIDCVLRCTTSSDQGFTIDAIYGLATPLSPGDEGALVVGEDGLAVGIVVWNGSSETLIASISDVLNHLQVELIVTNQQLALFPNEVAYGIYSHDGSMLAAGGRDGYILVWDTENLTSEPLRFTSKNRRINTIRFSLDDSLLIAGDDGGEIFVWDLAKPGQFLTSQYRHLNSIASLGILLRDGKQHIISSSFDGTIRIWDFDPSASEILRPRISLAIAEQQGSENPRIRTLTIRPEYSYLASSVGEKILLWELSRGWDAEPLVINTQSGAIIDLEYSPNGQFLASATSRGIIELRSRSGRIENPTLQVVGHSSTIWDIAFSPNGRFLVSSGSDGYIKLWEIKDLSIELVTEFADHDGNVFSVNFSPNGDFLVSAGTDAIVRIWMLPKQFSE